MPEGIMTLLDLKKLEAGIGYNLIEENIVLAPELSIIPADYITGTEMSLTVRTDLPTVAFRKLNEGTARSKSGYDTRIFQTAILDHQVAVDTQLLANRAPAAKGRVLENHASGVVEAAVRKIGKQTYYGIKEDDKGFIGLIAQMVDVSKTIDAGGTTANEKTSVFFIVRGREKLEYLFGNDTTINLQPDWKEETVYDANQKPYQALTNWMTGAVGLRLANQNSAVRIKNITTQAGKTCTDDLLYKAYNLFMDIGLEPTQIFMNGRSHEQLRISRATDLLPNPPLPKDFNGIPIVRTASIINGETI